MDDDNLNCHFVSRFLTRPWEFGPKRELQFYDFTTKRIDRVPSKDLFARRGLNTPAIEKWLNHHIEAPLGRFRKILRKRTGSIPNQIDDLEVLRALLLLMPLQVTRIAKVFRGPSELDQIFDWSKEKLDNFVATMRATHSLKIVQGHPQSPLFYVEHGYFFVPLPGASHEHIGAGAIPLTEFEAVVSVPRAMDDEVVTRTFKQGEGAYLNNCSVGANANRVVIHPGIVDAMGEGDLIQEIENARARNRDLLRASKDLLHIVDRAARNGDGS